MQQPAVSPGEVVAPAEEEAVVDLTMDSAPAAAELGAPVKPAAEGEGNVETGHSNGAPVKRAAEGGDNADKKTEKDVRGEVTFGAIKMLAAMPSGSARPMTPVKDSKTAHWTAFAKLMATHFHLVHHPTIFCLAMEKKKRKEMDALANQATLADNCATIRKESAFLRTCMSLLFFPLLICMPFIYAHTLMEFPCEEEQYHYEFQNVNGTNLVLQIPETECQVELFLKSPMSLLLTPVASLAVLAIFFAVVPLVTCFSSCCPKSRIVKSMHSPWRPLWVLNQCFHGYFRPSLSNISMNSNGDAEKDPVNFIQKNSYFFAGALYWIVLYLIMLVQFTAIALVNGNALLGCLVGYAVSELFLKLADTTMGQTTGIVGMVEGEVAEAGDIFTTLRTHDSSFIALSSEQLKAVEDTYPLLGGFIPDAEWLAYMMHVSQISAVYITDANELVNVKKNLMDFEKEGTLLDVDGAVAPPV